MVSNNYTPEIVEALNDLLGSFFQMNSISDNMAYALDCELNCPCASQVFHLKFAHVFPSDTFADKLSEVMIQEGIRPVRKSLNGNEDTYENIQNSDVSNPVNPPKSTTSSVIVDITLE